MPYTQSRSAQSTNSASARTLTYNSSVAAGALLVVDVTTFNSGTATVTVTDNAGGGTNSHTQAGSYQTIGSLRLSTWYFFNSSGGTVTVTVTPSVSVYMTLAIHEYAGCDNATAPQVAGATGGPNNNAQTGSVTAASGDMVHACYSQATIVSNSTVAAPFTERTDEAGLTSIGFSSADDVSASGSEGASFTISSGNASWAAIATSFKPSGGGGGTVPAGSLALLGVGM